MAENLLKLDYYAFRGNIPEPSFMRNGYAIWTTGLKDLNSSNPIRKPNVFAKKQGETYVNRMFYLKSLDKRSSYYQLLEYLGKIGLKEAEKEQVLIQSIIDKQIKSNGGQINDRLAAVQRAIQNKEFGMAYTLLLENEEEFETFQKDFSKKGFNIGHKNLFWQSEYQTFLKNRITEWINDLQFNDTSLTVEQIVDDWISQLSEGSNGLAKQSVSHLRNGVIKETEKLFREQGILYANNSMLSPQKFKSLLDKKGYTKTPKKKKDRPIETQISVFVREVCGGLAKGLSQELSQTAKQGKTGIALNTGHILHEIKKAVSGQFSDVQIKTDVLSYVAAEIEIDQEKLIQDLSQLAEDDVEKAQEIIEQKLLELKRNSDTGRIFKVSTNVKGYKSNRNLQIAGEGSFAQRAQNISNMIEKSKVLPGFSMEKLIFMLANTTQYCIADNLKGQIGDYIAAICAAWMWDDYTDLFSTIEDKSGIEQVRMFASGGVYYSASQIIKKGIENLDKNASLSADQFVVVDIIPPSFQDDAVYTDLVKQYPLDIEQSYQQQQNLLAQRWQAMRDKVMKEGKMSISFNQRLLEQLIGDLEGILFAK